MKITKNLKLFIAFSLILHLLAVVFILVPWARENDLWKGGNTDELVTVLLVTSRQSSIAEHQLPVNNTHPQTTGHGSPATGDGSDPQGSPLPNTLALIRQKIEWNKQYPLVAQRKGLEGRVEVVFKLNQEGGIHNLSIVQSSGFLLLDQEALSTVKRGAPYPYYDNEIKAALKFELAE